MSNFLNQCSEGEYILIWIGEQAGVGARLEELADRLPSLLSQVHAEIINVEPDVLADDAILYFLGVGVEWDQERFVPWDCCDSINLLIYIIQ